MWTDSTGALRTFLTRTFWAVPSCFYLATASPTPGWVDAPLLAKFVYTLELSTWVNHHNLFTLLGKGWLELVPASVDPHRALNLLCAVLGAVTVYVVFRVGLRLTDNPFASALGSLVLMVSHSLWWHSTMLEVYTLSTALLALTVLFVVRYDQRRAFSDLCVAALFFGLACSNHQQMALVGLGFLGLSMSAAGREDLWTPRRLGLLTLCFLAGFQVYLWVFAIEFVRHMGSSPLAEPLGVLGVMVDRTTGAGFKQYMLPSGLSFQERLFWWAFYLGFFLYNFVPPWIVFAPVGLVAWIRKRELRASLAFFTLALLAQVAWSANYLVWDMYAFSLPAYVLTAILIIVGIDWAWRRSRSLRVLVAALTPTLVLVPALYASVPGWIAKSDSALVALGRIPQYGQATAFWDPLEYFFNPNKRTYDRVDRYAQTILTNLEPDACFWGSEATMLYPLQYYYQDVLGERPDVNYTLVFGIVGREEQFQQQAAQMIEQLEQGCPVYVSSREFPERSVLDYVYSELQGEGDVAATRALATAEFVETFPGYGWKAVQVDTGEGVRVYRLRKRQQPRLRPAPSPSPTPR